MHDAAIGVSRQFCKAEDICQSHVNPASHSAQNQDIAQIFFDAVIERKLKVNQIAIRRKFKLLYFAVFFLRGAADRIHVANEQRGHKICFYQLICPSVNSNEKITIAYMHIKVLCVNAAVAHKDRAPHE